MYDAITFMSLVKEISFIFDTCLLRPEVFCKVFQDNQICITVAGSIFLNQEQTHIAIKYHHLRSFLQRKKWICNIDTREQTAYILANPLDGALFFYIRSKLSGWWNIKGETFVSTWGSLGIFTYRHQIQTHNWFRLKWQFIFRNASERILVSFKMHHSHSNNFHTVFNWTHGSPCSDHT